MIKYISIGAVLATAAGFAIGNTVVGIVIGAVVGAVLGAIFWQASNKWFRR